MKAFTVDQTVIVVRVIEPWSCKISSWHFVHNYGGPYQRRLEGRREIRRNVRKNNRRTRFSRLRLGFRTLAIWLVTVQLFELNSWIQKYLTQVYASKYQSWPLIGCLQMYLSTLKIFTMCTSSVWFTKTIILGFEFLLYSVLASAIKFFQLKFEFALEL